MTLRARNLAAAFAVAVAVAAAVPAVRHTVLLSSTPEADADLPDGVSEIVLTFSTPVAAPLSTITVTGPAGAVAPTGAVEHPPEREDQIRVAFAAPLAGGNFSVDWSALAPDGHVITGVFSFSVAAPPSPVDTVIESEAVASPSPTEIEDPATDTRFPVGTGARWAQLFGSALLLGAVAMRLVVVPGMARGVTPSPQVHARLLARMWGFSWVGVVALAFALPLLLTQQLAAIGDVGLERASFLLFQTAWGGGWLLQLLAGALAVLGLIMAGRGGGRAGGW